MDLMGDGCTPSQAPKVDAICVKGGGEFGAPPVSYRDDPRILTALGTMQRTLDEARIPSKSKIVVRGQVFFDDEQNGVGFCHVNIYPALVVVKDVVSYAISFTGKEQAEHAHGEDAQPKQSRRETPNPGKR
jgi:hypothetical protein